MNTIATFCSSPMPSHRMVSGIQVIEGSGRSSETNGSIDRLGRPPDGHDDAERHRDQGGEREAERTRARAEIPGCRRQSSPVG